MKKITSTLIMSLMICNVFAQVIMDELNGLTLGTATGITYTATPNGQGAVFSRNSESRIEYPFSMGLPHQGTIEMLIKVTKAYSYDNYTLLDNQSNAVIFNTGPSDVWYLGAMWLVGNVSGDISLATALTATPTAHTLSASSTAFRFNEWHVLSFSYGSQGQYLKVDGQLVASNSNYTETLQACGSWGSTRDNPTIGKMKSVFWGNKQFDQGIEGILDRFRASSTQQDWKLTLNSAQSITVTAPNGGENWTVNSSKQILWNSSNISNVKIEYSTNDGSVWNIITSSTSAIVGSYTWTVPNSISTNCKIKISDALNSTTNDMSNAVFSIVAKLSDTSSPQLFLSSGSITAGNQNIISGSGFSPLNSVKINLLTNGVQSSQTVQIDYQGTFSYAYTAPSSNSIYYIQVSATDVATGKTTITKTFQIKATDSTGFITTSPSAGQCFHANQTFNVTFEDLMSVKNGIFTYPTVTGNPASRYYSYTIEYQIGAGTPWQTYKTITGFALKNCKISKNISLTIKNPNTTCQVRVIDNYCKTMIANSSTFSVTDHSSKIKIEMDWDKSFPKLDAPLLGVAADGTARVFLKVSKLDQASSEIKSVTINLEDGTSNSTALLGKIQICIDTDYSLEANDASTKIATDYTADANGKFWFWYVAPDDFADSTTPFYSSAKDREVNAIIVASKFDGTTEIDTLKIKIVRPPLVMVHGINSDNEAWNNFEYSDNYGIHKFIDGKNTLLVWKKAVKLDKKESYINNAIKLLDQNDTDNSLQGNIIAMRELGYACNRVDYVCHSMGGCVMRTAINSLPDKFYSKNSCENSAYKTYDRGFINKAITINTPHDGSPFADLITDVAPHLSSIIEFASWVIGANNRQTLSSFVQRTNIIYWNPLPTILWTTTPAVKNLQVLNGVSFPETFVRNHLIASNVNSQKNICETGYESIENYVRFMTNVMQKMLDLFPSDKSLRIILKSTENPSQKICAFFDWYTNMKHLDNPLFSGDLIVGLKSQVAGLSLLSLPSNTTVISTPINSNPIDYWHCGILDRLETGNRVKELLNSSISSNLFGSSILAKSDMKLAPSLRSKSELIDNSIEIHDTTKVKIELPLRMKTVLIDSTIEIRFHLKDTLNLIYVNMTFQGNQYSSDVSVTNQSYMLQVNPDYIDKQQIVVTAAYLVSDHIERHIDTLSVSIQTKAPLIGFSASPEVSSISKNQPFYPSYIATYSTFLANVPFNDPQLSVTVDNPLIVSYNSLGRYFEGICDTTSSTFAVISYQGFKDTIYIEVQVIDTLSSPTTENFSIKENGKINCIDFKVFPNPVSTILNIEVVGESKEMSIEILNLMGQIVFKGIFLKKMEVKTGNFSTGIYLIKINDGKSFEYKKFIKK